MMSKTSKKYTKKQILESIKYWQKQLKAGNYKRVNESSAQLNLTNNEREMLRGYFEDLFTAEGECPAQKTLEAVEFKDDPTYADGGAENYADKLKRLGKPSLKWEAEDYCIYATDGKGFKDLASAFDKLSRAGVMSCDPRTGVITYDNSRLSMAEEDNGAGVMLDAAALDGEVI